LTNNAQITTPGGVVEWLAGRDGQGPLTGAGKTRLTPDAKKPSEKPSEKPHSSKTKAESLKVAEAVAGWDDGGGAAAGWGAQEEKSKSKKSASKKAASQKDEGWSGVADGGLNIDAKSGSQKSKSKKGDGEDAWASGRTTGWDKTGVDSKSNKSKSKKAESNSGGRNNTDGFDANATTGGADATGVDGKKDEAIASWETKEAAKDDNGGNDAEFDPLTVAAAADKGDEKKDDISGWTADEDQKLMDLKNGDAKIQWTKVAEEMGKDADECKEHFKKIKPKDWKPPVAVTSGDGGGAKKGKGKDKKNKGGNHNQDGNNKGGKKGGDKKEEKKEEEKKEEAADTGDDLWTGLGGLGADDDDNKKDDTEKANDWTGTGNDGANDSKDARGNKTGNGGITEGVETSWGAGNNTSGDVVDPWGGVATTGADAGPSWDNNKDQSNNTGGGFDASNNDCPAAAKPASVKASSNKIPSRALSHKSSASSNKDKNTTNARPLEYEVKPDKDFSADDLRLIARILQQDCAMVWNRVSWRFKDKTGRTMHPDVFERKITGRLEGKGSERSERRR
jgi:hypothetical protein